MPTTRVLKSRGTMIDLIIRKKTEETAFSATARLGKSAEGKKCPSAIPTTIEIMIQWVELTLDFFGAKVEDKTTVLA